MEAIEDLVPRQRPLVKRIVAALATTLAGLQVRSLILAEIFGGEEPDDDDYADQLMIRAIVRDLAKIAARTEGRRLRAAASIIRATPCDQPIVQGRHFIAYCRAMERSTEERACWIPNKEC